MSLDANHSFPMHMLQGAKSRKDIGLIPSASLGLVKLYPGRNPRADAKSDPSTATAYHSFPMHGHLMSCTAQLFSDGSWTVFSLVKFIHLTLWHCMRHVR